MPVCFCKFIVTARERKYKLKLFSANVIKIKTEIICRTKMSPVALSDALCYVSSMRWSINEVRWKRENGNITESAKT